MQEDSTSIWAQNEYHFHGQRPDEHVMLVTKQHPIVLAPATLIALVSLLIPYLLFRFLPGVVFYGIIAYMAILVYYLSYHLYGYQNSISILSDQRIVNVDQKGFFRRRISEAELGRIQDVSTSVGGILPTFFDYGNVTIRTASKDSLLILNRVSGPYDVQQAIVRALKDQNLPHT